MLSLRLRLALTVFWASVGCAVIGATLLGALTLHQQKKFEIQRIKEAYSVATSDLGLGNMVSLVESVPALDPTAISEVRGICHATGVGLALLPSYASDTPSAATPNFSADAPSQSLPETSTRFAIGRQDSAAVSRLASQPHSTVHLCGTRVSGAGMEFIEPLNGAGQSSVDLVLVTGGTSWLALISKAGIGSIALFAGVLVVAAIAARFAVRQLRAATLGYSPVQLAAIVEEQEAMLQGISEGVVGCDPGGRVRFFNSEAKRILNLPNHSVGRPIRVLIRGSRLRQVVSGETGGKDLPVVVGDSVVIVNNIQVSRGGQDLGYVVTLRDQTEWESLLKELDSLVGMTNALRAQAHEFSNKLHTIIGLIELGEPAEAIAVATEISLAQASATERMRESIGDPMISAMLLAKTAAASERAVDLRIDEASRVRGKITAPAEILSVIGNLIDNAIDAASSEMFQIGWKTADRGWVSILVLDENGCLHIEVSDSGPGIANDILPDIFTDGFSTKESRYGARRGLGLALVNQIVARSNGSVGVTNNPGAHFRITIPFAVSYEDGLRATGEVDSPEDGDALASN